MWTYSIDSLDPSHDSEVHIYIYIFPEVLIKESQKIFFLKIGCIGHITSFTEIARIKGGARKLCYLIGSIRHTTAIYLLIEVLRISKKIIV